MSIEYSNTARISAMGEEVAFDSFAGTGAVEGDLFGPVPCDGPNVRARILDTALDFGEPAATGEGSTCERGVEGARFAVVNGMISAGLWGGATAGELVGRYRCARSFSGGLRAA